MTPAELERFSTKYIVDEAGHWIWTKTTVGGYGWFAWDNRQNGAHIASYEHYIGPIPEGYEVDHRCKIKLCVNPKCLEAVTHSINMLRGCGGTETHCPAGHLREGNTRVRPGYGSQCILCDKEQKRTGGTPNRDKTHCPSQHEYTKENTYIRPKDGTRRCRTCDRIRKQKEAAPTTEKKESTL